MLELQCPGFVWMIPSGKVSVLYANLVWWYISMSLGPNLTDCELWMPAMHEIQSVCVCVRIHAYAFMHVSVQEVVC